MARPKEDPTGVRKIALQAFFTEAEANTIREEAYRLSSPQERVSVSEFIRRLVLEGLIRGERKTKR